jgi:hypothetical protein
MIDRDMSGSIILSSRTSRTCSEGSSLVEKNCGLPSSGAGLPSNSAVESGYEGFHTIQFGPFRR